MTMEFDKPSSVKKVEPASLRDSAMKKILAIADRASQESTKQQSFAKKVEIEKKKKRGGAPGDVVQLGKRDQPEPDIPRSILRAPSQQTSSKRRMLYPSRTEVFDMSDPIRVY